MYVQGPSPTVEDMSHVLEFLQLWHAVEPYKAYSREPWVLGRVRVRLVDEDGVPWNPDVPDRELLGGLDPFGVVFFLCSLLALPRGTSLEIVCKHPVGERVGFFFGQNGSTRFYAPNCCATLLQMQSFFMYHFLSLMWKLLWTRRCR